MRGAYPDITTRGAEVVAVGTGDVAYARAFVADEGIPFTVLVDDDAAAARAASVRTVGPARLLLDPRSLSGARRAHRAGFKVKKSGKRVTQLGATFVLGPGSVVHFERIDEHTADHAPLAEVLAAIPS